MVLRYMLYQVLLREIGVISLSAIDDDNMCSGGIGQVLIIL